LLCYITDRAQFAGDEKTRLELLLSKIDEAARCGVDYIQLREKDLPTRELEELAISALERIRAENSRTTLLINSRIDVALAVGAGGVHLRSDDISVENVREIYRKYEMCGADTPVREKPASFAIGVSCHTVEEVDQAAASGANFVVFGPVFEKANAPSAVPTGLESLHKACQQKIPVLALGGITLGNAGDCIQAGAAGIAAIRLFQENLISDVVGKLRDLHS